MSSYLPVQERFTQSHKNVTSAYNDFGSWMVYSPKKALLQLSWKGGLCFIVGDGLVFVSYTN